MQILARLMDKILKRVDKQVTVVGATSGDTGAAAIQAFAGLERINIFILFPDGHVSPFQRRQMTTQTAAKFFFNSIFYYKESDNELKAARAENIWTCRSLC